MKIKLKISTLLILLLLSFGGYYYLKPINVWLPTTLGLPEQADDHTVTNIIENAGYLQTVRLHINSPGGYVQQGFEIANAIAKSHAHVIAVVDGNAMSLAGLTMLQCDDLEVPKYGHVLIHLVQSNNGPMLPNSGNPIADYYNEKVIELAKPYLTPLEMDDLIHGRDILIPATVFKARWDAVKLGYPLEANK